MVPTYNQMGDWLEEIAAQFPEAFFEDLDGGIQLEEKVLTDPEFPTDDMYVMGEYVHDMLGRYILLYYGSFAALLSEEDEEAWKDEIFATVAHEFTHHLEETAGLHALDDKDLEFLREALAEYETAGGGSQMGAQRSGSHLERTSNEAERIPGGSRVERSGVCEDVVGRFAPSPSGRMHLGNLWSCLLAWLAARSAGGGMVLRLEDLDPDRCRQEYCDQIMRDLEWLGLDWDGEPVYQSKRTEAYAEAFGELEKQGLIYACFCTRAERLAASAPHRSDGAAVYDGRCDRLSAAERAELSKTRRPAWRVRVPEEEAAFTDLLQGPYRENLARDCGDFILRRSDGVFAYQLAVVVDDGAMGVTQVVRGSDLLSCTTRQLWLQKRLGLPSPEYGHLPLLLAPDGRRLAKRDRDQELGQLQERFTAPEIVGRLACAARLIDQPEAITPRELLPLFSWEKLPKQDITV